MRREASVNTKRLNVTFEGPQITEQGVPLDDWQKTLDQVQRAVRLLVKHLAGVKTSRGPLPRSLKGQSTLRLVKTSPGSLTAELELAPPIGVQLGTESLGAHALDLILDVQEGEDREGFPSLPPDVAASLHAIERALSPDVNQVRLGDAHSGRSRILRRAKAAAAAAPMEQEKVDALVYGRLMEVNWEKRTAELHRYHDSHVRLRFDDALYDDMRRLATQYVEVHGEGTFTPDDEWRSVRVTGISSTRSESEPFGVEELDSRKPLIFGRDEIVTASEPFDVDDFIRIVHEGRDV